MQDLVVNLLLHHIVHDIIECFMLGNMQCQKNMANHFEIQYKLQNFINDYSKKSLHCKDYKDNSCRLFPYSVFMQIL